ncbi:unnamed protein product, partial [Allacma fusca]
MDIVLTISLHLQGKGWALGRDPQTLVNFDRTLSFSVGLEGPSTLEVSPKANACSRHRNEDGCDQSVINSPQESLDGYGPLHDIRVINTETGLNVLSEQSLFSNAETFDFDLIAYCERLHEANMVEANKTDITDTVVEIMKNVNLHPDLSENLEIELREFAPIFTAKPGLCTLVEQTIDTGDGDGKDSFRLAIDNRPLNAVTKSDAMTSYRVDDLLVVISQMVFRSKVHLTKEFFQTLVREEDRDKTAFHGSDGLYKCKRSPFGAKNSGRTFQRNLNQALQVSRKVLIKSHHEDLELVPLIQYLESDGECDADNQVKRIARDSCLTENKS